jgi:choline dehydrogenase
MSHYDYIVIGAGSAGCVIANRLSEDPHVAVLLLEACDTDFQPAIHQSSLWDTLWNTDVNWSYATEPEPALDHRRIACPRGKVLGGSSAINAMIYIRGNRRDFDQWHTLGNPGWAWTDVLP